VNELTIGFGATVLGAIFTYLAGLKMAAPAQCTAPPLRVKMARWINRQAAFPRGLFGRFLAWNWRRETAKVNQIALELLDIGPRHHVLEVGSGPGVALSEAARRASEGKVVGLDVSPLMVELATKQNREAVARGGVEVRRTDGEHLGFDPQTFDRIFSVHCLYFWRDLGGTVAELAKSLRDGGRIVLAFRPEGPDVPARFRDPTYRFYHPEEVVEALEHAGLRVVGVERRPSESPHAVWVVAERR
jgi:SAM-dependent methyltransferase